MKIALMTLSRRGGMLQYLIETANALNNQLEIIVITAKWADTRNLTKNISHYTLDTGKNALGTLYKLLDFRNYFNLYRILKLENIDIIHFTGLHEWNPIIGLFLNLFYRKAIIYTVHDPIHVKGTKFHTKVQDLLFRKLASRFVVLSKKGKRDILKTGISSSKVKVLPLGMLLDLRKWENENIFEKKQFLFWGRIEKYKGLDLLLKSSSEVLSNLPDWKILIAGSGDISPYKKLITHERIIVINRFLSEKEISEFIQESKILVFPYREGNMSGIIWISMAFQKGVVATDTGAVNEILTNELTGLLVQKDNSKELAKAMIRLAKDSELLIKLGSNYMGQFNEEMTWGNIAKQYKKYYLTILNQ